jgi:xylan 1,4-beta-xylosidase
MEFQWLRTPYPERLFTLTGKALRLHARESIGSWFEQSLVARRQENFAFRSETSLDFRPHDVPAGRRASRTTTTASNSTSSP